ncbi:MAG TPA: SGNH/GDSL hydrolase family protein [Anaerolineales bacterium]|nr:SGNH/GDSL hydrolase family protein [Anaerolineales bacterium]
MLPIQYLALGDSYTIGESVEAHERWPNQLASLIETTPEFAGRRVDVSIIARTGWTTQELWEGIQGQKLEPPFDLVSLLIGVNNQYRGYDIQEYRQQFVFVLSKAIEYAGGDPNRVVVLSIPDWGVTPFAADRDREKIAKDIDAFNAVNRGETEKAGAHYVDVTPISREASDDVLLIAPDGLHPSGRMYAEWAGRTFPIVSNILQDTERR